MPIVLSPRDLVFRPDNMDETVPHTHTHTLHITKLFMSSIVVAVCDAVHDMRTYIYLCEVLTTFVILF